MKIIVIGASGALGTAVSAELSARHETVAIGRSSGDFNADMRELTSLRTMFQKVGKVDAIVCTAGSVHFGPWSELTPEKFEIGLRDKLMGQVNVVLVISRCQPATRLSPTARASKANKPARFTKFGDSCADFISGRYFLLSDEPTVRLFVKENTLGTALALRFARFLSDSESTTPSSVTFPFFTMMWMEGSADIP